MKLPKKLLILLSAALTISSCGGETASEPTPSPEPSPTPTVTLTPTEISSTEPTVRPDYEKHYISRDELIDGHENMSEKEVQRLLDIYDLGFEDGRYNYVDEFGDYDAGYDDGYNDGYNEGHDDGYDDGNYSGYNEAQNEYDHSHHYDDDEYSSW